MRSVRIAGLLLVICASTLTPSQAQPFVAASATNVGAWATFRFDNTNAWFWFIEGTEGEADAVPLDYDTDSVVRGCAAMSSYRIIRYGYGYRFEGREDQGCGRLTATRDPLLDVMRVRGSLRSYYTGDKMAIDLTFRSLTPTMPFTDMWYGFPRSASVYPRLDDPEDSASAYVGASLSSGLRREAQISGSMGSSVLPIKRRQGKGYVYQGAAIATRTSYSDDECC